MQYSIINYSHHAGHYIPVTYLYYNWKVKVKVKLLSRADSLRSHGQQPAPSSSIHGISRQEYWSELLFPSPTITGRLYLLTPFTHFAHPPIPCPLATISLFFLSMILIFFVFLCFLDSTHT